MNSSDVEAIDLTNEKTGSTSQDHAPKFVRKRKNWSTAERIVVHATLKEHNNSVAATIRHLSLKFPSVYGSLRESTVRGWFKEVLPLQPMAEIEQKGQDKQEDPSVEILDSPEGTDLCLETVPPSNVSKGSSKESRVSEATVDTVMVTGKDGNKSVQLKDKKVSELSE